MKRILLKLSGTFLNLTDSVLTRQRVELLCAQFKQLATSHQFVIVIGGGGILRGSSLVRNLKVRAPIAHTCGMLATSINALVLADLFQQHDISAFVLYAPGTAPVGIPLRPDAVEYTLAQLGKVAIIAGGSGLPHVTTDTAAVLHALTIGANEVWKATNVDGIYSADPKKQHDARLLQKVTYKQALESRLHIMDQTALALAQDGHLLIKVFNFNSNDYLIKASGDSYTGSYIVNE